MFQETNMPTGKTQIQQNLAITSETLVYVSVNYFLTECIFWVVWVLKGTGIDYSLETCVLVSLFKTGAP